MLTFAYLLVALLWIEPANAAPPPSSLDIDDNGHYDALTDGVLVMRYLLGKRGADLSQGVVDVTGQRTDSTAIEGHLASLMTALDVNCDGVVTPLIDGLLILRRLFGFTGGSLTWGLNASPCDTTTLEKNLLVLAPLAAKNQSWTLNPNGFYSSTLLSLHLSGTSLTYSLLIPPTHGTLTISTPSTGAFTYTPLTTLPWVDSFVFTIQDKSNTATGTGILHPVTNLLFTNSFGMSFRLIEAGTFTMGSATTEAGRDGDEGPQHQVTLSQAWQIQTTEVTQGQYKAIMGNNPANFNNCGLDCPVEQISWNDVQGFIAKLNTQGEGIYRLPTEAEWEYAARAGTTTPWSFGEQTDWSGYYGWYDTNSLSKTHPVAQKLPNAWGLFDMHGNVWEWVEDWYDPTGYTNAASTNPRGPATGSNRVTRGGGWGSQPSRLRSAYRYNFVPEFSNSYLGFRLVRVVTP